MSETDPSVQAWLEAFLSEHGGVAGSVHVPVEGMLALRAQVNLPPPVVALTRRIPKGKGMAGLAWERGRPVATCDLQTDESGDVRPGAKAVNAQAALAIPVDGQGGVLRAVVGIAFLGERDFSEADLQRYQSAASQVPEGATAPR